MAKFKKEKVLFFKKDLRSHCACGMRGDDDPWREPPRPRPRAHSYSRFQLQEAQ
jgi:hypothetical protein